MKRITEDTKLKHFTFIGDDETVTVDGVVCFCDSHFECNTMDMTEIMFRNGNHPISNFAFFEEEPPTTQNTDLFTTMHTLNLTTDNMVASRVSSGTSSYAVYVIYIRLVIIIL